MMTGTWKPVLFVLLLEVVVLVTAEPSTEAKKEDAVSDVTSQESKDKRSQEEIMFGNQQNKPAGLMDDILTYKDKKDEEPIFTNSNANAAPINTTESQKEAEESEDKTEKDQTPTQDNTQSKAEIAERRYDYLDYVDDNSEQRYTDSEYNPPSSSGNQQEDGMEPQLYPIPDVGTYPTYDFSNALYRRKRNLRNRVLPIRKRSLRSSLKDLLSGRKRLSRRALRLKRQTNVENLLALLEPLTDMEKEGRYGELPEALNRYDMLPEDVPEMQDAGYGYGYTLPANVDGYQSPREMILDEDDISNFPTYGKEEERQPWYYRSQPFYKVERRSPSYFYPIDYRFINVPAHKKRSRSEGDQDRWGKVVQVPSSHNPTEDMARLYALASLLADAEEPEYRYRRSA